MTGKEWERRGDRVSDWLAGIATTPRLLSPGRCCQFRSELDTKGEENGMFSNMMRRRSGRQCLGFERIWAVCGCLSEREVTGTFGLHSPSTSIDQGDSPSTPPPQPPARSYILVSFSSSTSAFPALNPIILALEPRTLPPHSSLQVLLLSSISNPILTEQQLSQRWPPMHR